MICHKSKLAFSMAMALTGLSAGAVCAQTVPPKPEVTAFEQAPWWVKTPVIAQLGYVRTEMEANRAEFSAQFQTVGKTPEEAQNKAVELTRELTSALKKLGTDKVRVTTDFSIRTLYQQYRDKDGNRIENERADKIEAYEVSQSLSLEVRDLSVLERAYALVLAASPTSSGEVDFNLEPSNETKSWLYGEALKDAHRRAKLATSATGATLGRVLVIDSTSRACQTDVLARNFSGNESRNYSTYIQAPVSAAAPSDMVQEMVVTGNRADLAAKAFKNVFIQIPPLETLTAQACVVYGLN